MKHSYDRAETLFNSAAQLEPAVRASRENAAYFDLEDPND
jgi:hypothetical protein